MSNFALSRALIEPDGWLSVNKYGMVTEKLDALDLIISILRDHEEALADSIYQLEGIELGKPARSASEQLLSTAKEIAYLFKQVNGCDLRIRVNVSKNEFLEVDIARKRRRKARKDDSLKGGDSQGAYPIIIT